MPSSKLTAALGASAVLLFGGLALAANRAAPDQLWSLYYPAHAVLAAIGAALISFALTAAGPRFAHCAWLARPAFASRSARILFFSAGLAGGLLFFGLLRVQLFLPPPEGLGDSRLILEHVPVYAQLLGYVSSFDELLDYYFRSRFYLWSAARLGLSVEDGYALISWLFFIPYWIVVFDFVRDRTRAAAALALGLFLSTPALALFAGYVESYTMVAAYMAVALLPIAKRLESPESARRMAGPLVLWAALWAAWGVLHHLYAATTILALAGLTIVLARNRRHWLQLALGAGGAAAALLAAVWGAFLFVVEPPLSIGESHAANPPIESPFYFFSAANALDSLNVLLYAAPAVLPVAPLLAFAAWQARAHWLVRPTATGLKSAWSWLARTPAEKFALLALAPALGLSLVHSAYIGYPADADLQSLYFIALLLWLFYVLQRALESSRAWLAIGTRIVAPAAIVFSAGLLVGWLWRNHQFTPDSAANLAAARRNVASFLAAAAQDPVYAALSATDRRRTYIQVKLFFVRSRERLARSAPADFSAEERAQLTAALAAGETRFDEWILFPEPRFSAERAALWASLTDLNVRINGGR